MAVRVTEAEVQGIIDNDSTISMTPFITNASVLVDRLETLTGTDLSAAELKAIELYLSAHLYSFRDPQYKSKRTDLASAVFQGETKMYLESTYWGQYAMTLDHTGTLQVMNKGRPQVEIIWGGTA